jgi:hypothetical protein
MAMTLVSTVTVGSGGAANIEWTAIDQSGKDLLLLVSPRTDRASGTDNLAVALNASTSNFTFRRLYGTGTATASQSYTAAEFRVINTTENTSNTFSNVAVYFSNYASSAAKSISADLVQENNATEAYQHIIAGLWNDTSAITSIKISPSGGTNFLQHTTASLYIIS